MNKLGFLTQTIFFAATMSVALLPDLVSAQNVEITLSSRVEVDNAPYTGSAQVKAVIIDEAQTSLWSNDSTSSAASEPAGSIAVTVLDGNFNITLGGTGTATLAGSIFDGAAKRFVLLWLDAGAGFERFDPLPISTVPRAVTALRLGNLPAADYLTTSSTLSIGNTDLSEAISSDNIAAFSDGGDTFTLGDGSVTGNKLLEADVGATNNPALRFNTTSSTWQFSNDGTTFTDVGSAIASDFVGPGSTTSAVDLNSAEVAGVLPLANGGTGAATAAAARISLGVDIGVDVQAYLKNNLAAVTGPTATDDSAAGYAVGSTWVDTAAGESYVAVDVTAGAAVWSSTTAANAASIADDSITNAKLADDAVTTAEVLDGTLVDADISASAAIAHSKLANINAGRVLLGNAGNVPTATAISGDATLTSGGVLALTAGSVGGAEIAIAGQTSGDYLTYNGASWTGFKNNFSAVSAPTVNDDSGDGYTVGSTWVDTASDMSYVATDVTVGAAVWQSTTGATTASIADNSITNAKMADDAIGNAELQNDAVTAAEVLDLTLTDNDLSATAAIAHSKLANITAGRVLLGNAGNVPTATAISGDATLTSGGVLALTAGSVGGAEIAIAGQTSGDYLTYNGASWTGFKNNFSAVSAPTVNDDSGDGYTVGSTWVDTASDMSYVATDVTVGAAVWQSTTGATTASIADNSINNAKMADDAIGNAELQDDAVTAAEVLDLTLTNNDINAAAAIAHSKLANITAGQVLLGNAGNVPTATAISGDATLTSGGVLALTAGSVSGTEIAIGGDAQGDLLYYNGSAWTRLGAGTSGNILVTGGTGANPSWAAAGSLQVQQPVLGRRLGSSTPLTTAATAFTAVGMTAPTVTVAGTAQPALSGTRMYIRFATTAVANNSNGITGPLTETRPGYRPKYTSLIRTDSTIASRRIWVGLTSAVLTAVPTNTTGSPATAASFVGIAYDTGGTGNVTDWLCCSGDGANYSCTTTGVAVAIDTDYVMSVDWSTVGTLRCTVNSTSVNKTTNLATGATNMGPYNNITTLAAVIANHNIAKQALEQN